MILVDATCTVERQWSPDFSTVRCFPAQLLLSSPPGLRPGDQAVLRATRTSSGLGRLMANGARDTDAQSVNTSVGGQGTANGARPSQKREQRSWRTLSTLLTRRVSTGDSRQASEAANEATPLVRVEAPVRQVPACKHDCRSGWLFRSPTRTIQAVLPCVLTCERFFCCHHICCMFHQAPPLILVVVGVSITLPQHRSRLGCYTCRQPCINCVHQHLAIATRTPCIRLIRMSRKVARGIARYVVRELFARLTLEALRLEPEPPAIRRGN